MVWQCKWPTLSRLGALVALVLAIALGMATPKVRAEAQTYAVVVSPDVETADLELDDLRRIFRFQRRFWRSGRPLTLLFSEENLVSGSFLLDRVYGTDYTGLRKLIMERLYAGELDLAPKVVASDETAVTFVAAGSGLIAVVRADTVGEQQVKVLTVDGRAPGSADYPLRR